MQFDKNTKLFWTSSDNSGCSELRSRLPSEFLKQHFDWVQYSEGFPAGDPRVMEADIIHLQRANHEYFQTWIPEAKTAGKKILSDMDDNLWRIPTGNMAWKFYPNSELRKLDAVLKLSDVITVSTVPLKDFIQNKFPEKEIFILPNHINLNVMDEKPENDKIKIVYSGSYTHNCDWTPSAVEALRYVKNTYTNNVHITCIGHTFPFLKGIVDEFIPWIPTQNYYESFYSRNFDIGIIVAVDNEFNRSKSALKFMEYGNGKIATIAHNIYPYANAITDEVDGFLVKNEKKDWKKYLVELIEDSNLRKSVQNNAYSNVKQKHTFEGDKENIWNNYQDIFCRL